MEYKRKLRRSIMANKNTFAYHNGNHDDQRFSYKRNSTTVKELGVSKNLYPLE